MHRRLTNADFSGFDEVLAAALQAFAGGTISAVCLALAGPIADGGRRARLTNLPWWIDAEALEARFGLPRVRLVNDFTAAAMGAVSAGADQCSVLQAGHALADAPRLVVGAGTGLGMALALPQADGWRIVPGEGGHCAFAPADAEQVALWHSLYASSPRVTWERVVSGPGLEAIYRFICAQRGEPATLAITAYADAPAGSAAYAAIELFLRCYGAFAGDMALAVLARGGVYLAGGIAKRLQPRFERSAFVTAFNDKCEHAELAAQMPVSICLDPEIGLQGAARLSTI